VRARVGAGLRLGPHPPLFAPPMANANGEEARIVLADYGGMDMKRYTVEPNPVKKYLPAGTAVSWFVVWEGPNIVVAKFQEFLDASNYARALNKGGN